MNASFLPSTKPSVPIKPKNVTPKQISNLRQAQKMSLGDLGNSNDSELQRKLKARMEKNNMQ